MSMSEPFAGARVAVLDDSRHFQVLLRTMLRQMGFREIDVFGDPDEALRHVADVAVDLMLVDLVMPRRNGVDWVHTVRRRLDVANADMAIVMMSSHAVRAVLEPAVCAGIDAFLVKPFSAETLARHARGVLEGRSRYVDGPGGYWGPDFRPIRSRLAEIERGVARRGVGAPSRSVPERPAAPALPLRPGLPGLDVEIADRSRYSSDFTFLD